MYTNILDDQPFFIYTLVADKLWKDNSPFLTAGGTIIFGIWMKSDLLMYIWIIIIIIMSRSFAYHGQKRDFRHKRHKKIKGTPPPPNMIAFIFLYIFKSCEHLSYAEIMEICFVYPLNTAYKVRYLCSQTESKAEGSIV